MTLVNTETGEIVEHMSEREARSTTERIRTLLDSISNQSEKVVALIRDAREGLAWAALGYRSWTDYVSAEFADSFARVARVEQVSIAAELSAMGMSLRAVSAVTTVPKSTIADNLAAVRDRTPAQTPESPAAPSGTERQTGPGDSGQTPEGEESPSLGSPTSPRDGETAPRPPVTGIDGKQYARPEPKSPKPVLTGDAAEYANAEQAAKSLSRAIAKLLEFEHPNMRAGMRRYWDMASIEVPPAQRADVTPEQMRAAAHGLLTLADEWNCA